MNNCLLTIDFEDFKHDLKRFLSFKDTSGSPEGLLKATKRLDKILEKTNSGRQLTYFITGQVARDYPEIVEKISSNKNEIACHGNYHDMIYNLSQKEFSKSLDLATKYLNEASGQDIIGFRAPSFSINKSCNWAYEEIAKRFKYDSSYLNDTKLENPILNFKEKKYQMLSLPIYSPMTYFKRRIRVIGGTFLKILPLSNIFSYMDEALTMGYMPVIYIHPYELLTEDDFKISFKEMKSIELPKRVYWFLRQNQWLSIGNKSFIYKLEQILLKYRHLGTVKNYLKNNSYL